MNRLRLLHEKITTAFFRIGWLLPVTLPIIEITGRGVFNSLTAFYGVWGLLAMPGRWRRIDRTLLWVYLLPVVVFGISLISAVDLQRGGQTWVKFAYVILTLFFTVAAMTEHPENQQRFFRWMGISAGATLVVLVVHSLIVSGGTQLVLTHQMRERDLPFLLPFAILALGQIESLPKRRALVALAIALVAVAIILSAGRSALVGLLAASCILGLLRFRMHPAFLAAFCLVVVIAGALISGSWFFRDATLGQRPADVLDTVSSKRTIIWRQALASPPENQLIGVGMGNVRFYEEILDLRNGSKVRHLHNFLLDCWYETGFLGLLALLTSYGIIGRRAWIAWPTLSPLQRDRLATLIAAAVAIFAAGMLSFSYYSPQFTSYLFVLFAGIWVVTARTTPPDSIPGE